MFSKLISCRNIYIGYLYLWMNSTLLKFKWQTRWNVKCKLRSCNKCVLLKQLQRRITLIYSLSISNSTIDDQMQIWTKTVLLQINGWFLRYNHADEAILCGCVMTACIRYGNNPNNKFIILMNSLLKSV